MPSDKIARVSANRRTLRAEQHAGKQEKNLDDERTQAEILHPSTIEIDLGVTDKGAVRKVRLHQLSGYAVRALLGLAGEIFTDRSILGAGEARFRVLQPRYLARFLQILAIAHAPAGELSPEQADELARELDVALATARGSIELGFAFAEMVEQNGILEAMQVPKSESAPTPTT